MATQANGSSPAEQPTDDFINPNIEYNAKSLPAPVLATAWRFVSQQLLNLAVITTFLTIAGFFVVHTYLAKITGIYTYRIEAPIYIAAGINVILGTLAKVFAPIISTIPGMILPVLGLVGIVILFDALSQQDNQAGRLIKRRFVPIGRFLHRLNNILFISLLVLLIAFTAVGYGYDDYGYGYSEHVLGGGRPTSVKLIFREPGTIESLGLPLVQDPSEAAQSLPVDLLMELSDGVLVRDPQLGIPVVIRDELLYGIIDVPAATLTVIPTPTAIPPTPTP